MSDKLSFIFEILDKASGPLKTIGKAFDKVTSSIGKSANGGLIGNIMSKMPGFVQRGAGKVLQAFSGLGAKLGPVFGKIKGLFSAGKKGQAGTGGMFAGLGEAALGAVGALATVAAGIGTVIGGLAIAGGKFALESFMFKENTLAAFKAMLGSDEAAKRVMANAVQFAAVTPFSTEEVVTAYQKLLTAGVKEADLRGTMESLGDLGAALGTEKMDQAIRAIGQMKAKGKFNEGELSQLAEAGVNVGLVYETLAKKMGKSTDEIRKMTSAGKIDADTGVAAVLSAIDQSLSGGKRGSLMAAKSQTLEGLFSTLASKPFEFMISLDEQKILAPLKAFITNLTNILDPSTDTGKRIIGILQTIGDAASSIFGNTSQDDIEGGIKRMLDVLEPMIKMMIGFGTSFFSAMGKSLGPMFQKMESMSPEKVDRMVRAFSAMGEVLGFMVGNAIVAGVMFSSWFATMISGVVLLKDGFMWLWNSIGTGFEILLAIPILIATWFEGIKVSFVTFGADLVQGFIDGITSMLPSVGASLGGGPGGLAGIAMEAVRGALDSHSPSRVFEGIGSDTAQGFINGIQGLTGPLQGALGGMVSLGSPFASASAGAAGGAPGASGATITVYVQAGAVVIQGAGGDAKMAQSLETSIGDMFKVAAGQLGV